MGNLAGCSFHEVMKDSLCSYGPTTLNCQTRGFRITLYSVRDPGSPNPARQMQNILTEAVLTGATGKVLENLPFLPTWKSMCYSRKTTTSSDRQSCCLPWFCHFIRWVCLGKLISEVHFHFLMASPNRNYPIYSWMHWSKAICRSTLIQVESLKDHRR